MPTMKCSIGERSIGVKKIDSFEGKYYFLSNFSNSYVYDGLGIEYPTVEHYFQAAKTLDFDTRLKIAAAPTPGKAKRLGRHVNLRSDWNMIKTDVMRSALRIKFSQPSLRDKLLETGDAWLEEGNTWCDNIWGNCKCEKCKNIVGENRLGRLLMEIREELKN